MEQAVDDFINFLTIERNLAENTIEAYATDLVGYVDFLDSRSVDDLNMIEPSDISSYIVMLSENKITSFSIARKLSAIRMFHRFLIGEGITSINPVTNISFPKLAKKLPVVIDQFEIEKLLEQPDLSDKFGIRDKALLEFAYATGVRVSELISVKIPDLFFDEELVRVFGKGSKMRIIPIGESAIQSVEQYFENSRYLLAKPSTDETLFLNHHGNHYPEWDFGKY